MLPLHDTEKRVWIRRPWATYAIMALCVLLWLPQAFADDAEALRRIEQTFLTFGVIPKELALHTLVSATFLHAGFLHLFGNMLYLHIFADNVEDALGHKRFIFFFLLCGVIASLVHVVLFSDSDVPLVGASGAISGVLGAYLVLYPKAKILVPILFFPVFISAWLVIGFWFIFQILNSAGSAASGVAWFAHLGGFVAGLVLVFRFRRKIAPLFQGGDLPRGIRLRRE